MRIFAAAMVVMGAVDFSWGTPTHAPAPAYDVRATSDCPNVKLAVYPKDEYIEHYHVENFEGCRQRFFSSRTRGEESGIFSVVAFEYAAIHSYNDCWIIHSQENYSISLTAPDPNPDNPKYKYIEGVSGFHIRIYDDAPTINGDLCEALPSRTATPTVEPTLAPTPLTLEGCTCLNSWTVDFVAVCPGNTNTYSGCNMTVPCDDYFTNAPFNDTYPTWCFVEDGCENAQEAYHSSGGVGLLHARNRTNARPNVTISIP